MTKDGHNEFDLSGSFVRDIIYVFGCLYLFSILGDKSTGNSLDSGSIPDPKAGQSTGKSPLLLCTYALVKERELRRYLEMLEAYWPKLETSLCSGQ